MAGGLFGNDYFTDGVAGFPRHSVKRLIPFHIQGHQLFLIEMKQSMDKGLLKGKINQYPYKSSKKIFDTPLHLMMCMAESTSYEYGILSRQLNLYQAKSTNGKEHVTPEKERLSCNTSNFFGPVDPQHPGGIGTLGGWGLPQFQVSEFES